MNTQDEFVTLRRYTRAEAAGMLNIYDAWLKKWVTARCFPHRSGAVRGVFFTYDDIVTIGRMLAELTTGRQANARAEGPASAPPGPDTGGPVVPEPVTVTAPAHTVELFAGLRSLRSAG